MPSPDIIEAQRVLKLESNAIQDLSESLGEEFIAAVELMQSIAGKVIVSGVGKSGLIARKISSTLSSTGTPSLFVHPTEASHGDLGVFSTQDLGIFISYSGEAEELNNMLVHCKRNNIPFIGMTGNPESTLAQQSQICLKIAVKEEACPLKLAPTTSSTVTLALGDALAMALLKRKGFKEEEYAEFHPGGSLGRKLLTHVSEVMHTGEALPLIKEDSLVSEVISVMTGSEVRGAAGVVTGSNELLGIITDGDIRRLAGKGDLCLEAKASEIMSKNPKTIGAHELAQKALFVMEQFRINLLFVVDAKSGNPNVPVGYLHIQDLMRAKIR